MIGLGLVTFLPNFHKLCTKLYHPCLYLTEVPMTSKSIKQLHYTTLQNYTTTKLNHKNDEGRKEHVFLHLV